MTDEAGEIICSSKSATFERRKCPRFTAALPIEYWPIINYNSQGRPGHTINIGEGGLMVSLPEQLEVGEELKVKLYFSLDSGLDTIEAISKVVWAKMDVEKQGFYQLGLSFLDISRSDIKKAITFLRRFSD
jgi:c-di-GMP-binding flagellar brake protein YcgR